jgi:hypothetical protein
MGALLLLGPALRGADQPVAAPAPENPVPVDPLDLRTPIPEPEAGLTEKYDSKLVRFTGQVSASGQDARAKAYWYDLQTMLTYKAGVVAGTKGTAGKGTQRTVTQVVVVRAYFQSAQTNLRAGTPGNVTVEGRGEISILDGSLTIRNATVLDLNFARPAPGTAR